MGILNWIKNRKVNSGFEKTFSDLKKLGETNPGAKRTYELLSKLDFDTPDAQSELLISEFNSIRFHSNTNDFFYFYFPVVTHILYYTPRYEKDILGYLIGPNFANGATETKDLIPLIQRAMKFKLSENKNYLTRESMDWVLNQLPKMEKEIEREVQKCWKELDE